MTEVTGTGHDHGQTVFVSRCDDLFVTHRTARLDDGLGTGFGQNVHAVTEREESVRRDNATCQKDWHSQP